ncbi:MAG: flagellar hook-basal body complex protein FliE [Gammaproteobacteria bacterium]
MPINNVSAVRTDITEILSKMREMSNKTNVFSESRAVTPSKSFDDVLSIAKNSLSNVSHVQQESEQLKNAYIAGDSNVSMSQVIVASQKSKLAFEGLIAVRNKILEAYKEIMNMPI